MEVDRCSQRVEFGKRLEAWVFEESEALDDLAHQSAAGQLGLLEAMRLVLKRLPLLDATRVRGADVDGADVGAARGLRFWHDGHHPAAAVHEMLAAQVVELLKEP